MGVSRVVEALVEGKGGKCLYEGREGEQEAGSPRSIPPWNSRRVALTADSRGGKPPRGEEENRGRGGLPLRGRTMLQCIDPRWSWCMVNPGREREIDMDQAYSFNAPKAFQVRVLDGGTTPALLKTLLSGAAFHKGTISVQIQNIGADYVYWAWAAESPAAVINMGRLPIDSILRFNWEQKDLDKLWVAGDSIASRIIVLQEGK